MDIVPSARARVIRQQFNDVMEQAGQYYTLYDPTSSWKDLSVKLYRAGETSAMQLARKYLHTIKGTAVIVTVYCTCCTCSLMCEQIRNTAWGYNTMSRKPAVFFRVRMRVMEGGGEGKEKYVW